MLIVIFFVTLFVLTTMLFNPLFAVLDARRKAVEGAIEDSKTLGRDADAKKVEFESKVKEIKREAGEEREELRREARRAEAEILEKGKADSLKTVEDARAELDREISRVRIGLDAESQRLGQVLADRILGSLGTGGRP
ncbi:MAG: ATP synthase F0 subunit B [Deltaproteobacteria bacterium]|nr:ATP synthase F0 subunit B [Deltaproteobacteria bacterium]